MLKSRKRFAALDNRDVSGDIDGLGNVMEFTKISTKESAGYCEQKQQMKNVQRKQAKLQ
jgi:hypothetical protein